MALRVRETGGFEQFTNDYSTTTFGGTYTLVTSKAFSALQVGEHKTTTDVVTPRYHSRVARGDVINNPFTSVTERRSFDYSGVRIRRTSGSGSTVKYYDYSYTYSEPLDPLSRWIDQGTSMMEACTEAAARVMNPDVEGTVEAAEARKTMELFHLRQWNLRKQVEKELKYAQKRGFKFPINVPIQVMSNNWLKYRYGIMPLVRLLNDTLVTGTRIRTRRETSRGGGNTDGNDTQTITQTGNLASVDYTAVRSWTSSARAGILYEYRDFGNKYGFNLGDIPSAAWELVPYSFVVDWFLNTGDFIRALTPRVSVVRRATWRGYKLDLNIDVSVTDASLVQSGYVFDVAPSGGHHVHWTKLRRVPGLLSPALYVRENAIRKIITSERIVDAFALTSQQFFRLLRATR